MKIKFYQKEIPLKSLRIDKVNKAFKYNHIKLTLSKLSFKRFQLS